MDKNSSLASLLNVCGIGVRALNICERASGKGESTSIKDVLDVGVQGLKLTPGCGPATLKEIVSCFAVAGFDIPGCATVKATGRMKQLSTGDWLDVSGVVSIRSFEGQGHPGEVWLLAANKALYTYGVASKEEADRLRDEIAALCNDSVEAI